MARKKKILSIRVHAPENPDALLALRDFVSEMHAREIQRRIHAMNLTPALYKRLLDCILAELRAREAGGIIR